MLAQHANAAKIARFENVRRRNDTGESDRPGSAKRKPPVPLIELRNGCGVKKRQLMKLCKCVRNIVLAPVNLANLIHVAPASEFVYVCGKSTDHLPSVALMPSHTAPTNPVTIIVTTALKV